MAPWEETITIVNKSGKVVSTGKQLLAVFQDARDAYKARKAEIRAERRQRRDEQQALEILQQQGLRDDGRDGRSTTSRRSRSRHHHSRSHRHGPTSRNIALTEVNLSRLDEMSAVGAEEPSQEITRRHTDMLAVVPREPPPQPLVRAYSDPDLRDNVDMDLAYGYLPPELTEDEEEEELEGLMSKLDRLMIEAHCLHHTATTIMASLQSKPDAMAAIALTLAEVSSLVTKLGPSILTTIKAASPAIFALLMSPEFLIAGGVAMGVTIVMFGGYKIIKQIQASAPPAAVPAAPRLAPAMALEAPPELSRIENWRRGIEFDAESVATSADVELVSPEAARRLASGHRHHSSSRSRRAKSTTSRRAGTIVEEMEEAPAPPRSVAAKSSAPKSVASAKTSKSKKSRSGRDKDVDKSKEPKKPNALTLLLKGKSSASSTTSRREYATARSRSHRPTMIEV